MRCPYCNSENDDNAVYCGECGKQIKTNTQESHMDDDLWTENMTFSWKPDQDPNSQNVAPNPGPYQTPPIYTPPVPPKKNNTFLYAVIGVCLAAVILLAIVLGVTILKGNEEESTAPATVAEESKDSDKENVKEEDAEKDTEKEIEEETEEVTEEEIEYLTGVDPSNTADFTNNLSTDSYIRMSGEDDTLSFAYPRDFFSSDTEEENNYTFYSSDGSVTLHYWKEEVGSDGVSVLVSEFNSKKSQLNTNSKDDNGTERFSGIAINWSDEEIPHYVLGGRYTTDLYKGYYSVASLRNGAIYHMEFEYPVDYNNGFANPVNYMIDCLYRYCGFSGSSSAPRSYQEFQAAN